MDMHDRLSDMKSFKNFLLENKELIALIVSIVVGFSTIATSFVSIIIMMQQNRFADEQNKIQKLDKQPIFDICIYQQQDSVDGMFDTDILEIRNVGEKMTSCEITTNVFFAISYHHLGTSETIYAEINDYFIDAVHIGNEYGLVEKCWCANNNRIFSEGYYASIKDCKDDTFYFYDKIVLVKIEYRDVFREEHVVYFNCSKEIEETEYLSYLEASKKVFGYRFFSLHTIDYHHLKEVLDKRINTKTNR